jgi:hypothetical protein
MTLDEFLERVASEPNRTSERNVRVPTAELLEEMRAAGGMRVDALLADPRQTVERRTFRTGHVGIHLQLPSTTCESRSPRWLLAVSPGRLRLSWEQRRVSRPIGAPKRHEDGP